MEILDAIIMAAPYIKQAITEDVEIVVTDREKFLLYIPSQKLDEGIQPGDPIPPDDESINGALSGRLVSIKVPAGIYGEPFMARAFPVYDERKNVVGAIGIGYSLEKDVRLDQYMDHMDQISRQLQEKIHAVIAHAQELAATCEEGTQHAQQVAVSTAKTNEVIQFIRRVSNQTNLLGINAAIEATRAGQYGAGFQIVAQEVRKLSNESADATKQIEASLSEMRTAIDTLVDNMKLINASSQEQTELILLFTKLIEQLNETSQAMKTFVQSILRS